MGTRFLRFLLSLVLPADCALCGGALPHSSEGGVCATCESTLGYLDPPFCPACGRPAAAGRCGRCDGHSFHFDRAYACTYYEGPTRELLHLYKFSRRRALGRFFARRMAFFARTRVQPAAFDAVVAVPLDSRARRERGFNQSESVARLVAHELGVEHLPSAMRRSASPSPQSRLPRGKRKKNVSGRFSVSGAATLRGRRLLLVDDVLTTGHTASECARVLKEAGAASVIALAYARGA